MKRFILFAATVGLAIGGQCVWGPAAVRAGCVDAPCVHVEWGNGRVHVCAPFVDFCANLPACCGRPACCDEARGNYGRSWPQPANDEQSRQQLAESGRDLYRALDRFKTSEGWQHYLAVESGAALSGEQLQQGTEGKEKMEAVLEHFDSTTGDDQYRMISSLPAFRETRELLARYVARDKSAPAERNVSLEAPISKLATSPRWSPASTQPKIGLPAMARDIARPEELPTPPEPHGVTE